MTFSRNDKNGCISISSETPSCVNITQCISVAMYNKVLVIVVHISDFSYICTLDENRDLFQMFSSNIGNMPGVLKAYLLYLSTHACKPSMARQCVVNICFIERQSYGTVPSCDTCIGNVDWCVCL